MSHGRRDFIPACAMPGESSPAQSFPVLFTMPRRVLSRAPCRVAQKGSGPIHLSVMRCSQAMCVRTLSAVSFMHATILEAWRRLMRSHSCRSAARDLESKTWLSDNGDSSTQACREHVGRCTPNSRSSAEAERPRCVKQCVDLRLAQTPVPSPSLGDVEDCRVASGVSQERKACGQR